MARRTKPRRGVLLLIVLSLLVLFLLVGLSFMVSAGQFNRLAKSAARTENTGMPGAKLADAALYQILRGTANPYSVIQGHSLLEDLYGRDYAVIQTPASPNNTAVDYLATGGQMQQIQFNLADIRLGHRLPEDGSDPQELHDDYYAGCVLTFLNGPAKGISTRVLQYKPQASNPFVVIKGVNVPGAVGGLPQGLDGQPLRFIINGRPFNGTGAGYEPQLGGLNNGVSDVGVPLAFLPNYRSYRSIANLQPFLSGQRSYNYGGLDESWDSVDYQNFFLAKAVDVAKMQQAALAIAEVEEAGSEDELINNLLTYYRNTGGSTPSFHRPYLIQHLLQNASIAARAYERAIVARPSKNDHPAFTGSNPLYDPVAGPWDVDCNGDGIRDSIWIDAGLSPVAGKDGRLYKPLVATHIIDMGGRLNINAIESLERTKARVTPGMNSFTTKGGVIPASIPLAASDNAAFGLGYGPADISSPLSGVRAPNLLRSRYAGDRRDGNFQPIERAQALTPTDPLPSPFAETTTPGVGPADSQTIPTNFSDDDYLYDTRPVPRVPDYYSGTPASSGEDQVNSLTGIQGSLDTGYGSPSDYHARSLPYLDAHGNMLWAGRFVGRFDNIDDPYEINLLSKDTHDDPFDLSDLEAIHRVDIAYEQSRAIERLVDGNLANTIGQYTTHSFSIPVPPTINSGYRRGRAGDGLKRSLREMFAARIRRVRETTGSKTRIPTAVALAQASRIMAPELIRGEKLDINRVLVPNRPDQTPVQRTLVLAEKERFARNLFNLMMLLTDQGEGIGTGFGLPIPGASEGDRKALHARRLAQWAINTVDFGDADSVMTMLRYDVNPFNELEPFDLNGNLKPNDAANPEQLQDLGVVWGMEHPEMLLTETLAFHDRRAEDGDEGMTLADGDEDLDSAMEPEGPVFFELYCAGSQRPRPGDETWGVAVSGRAPEDLYLNQNVLDLGTRLPGSKPVWRLAISEVPEGGAESPKSLFENRKADLRSFEPAELDLKLTRFVWFCDTPPTKVDNEEDSENTYYNRRKLPALISPGSYFVVGPDDIVDVGLTKNGTASPQRISLFGDHRRVRDVPASRLRPTPPGPGPTGLPRLVGMVAESAPDVGCSISEPLGGYSSDSSGTPLDLEDDSPIAGDLSTRTIDDFRSVFLQRLADPTQPWDPVLNPYRTVDWMPIDLTVFNSLYEGSDDPDDPNPNLLEDFASREKSGVQPGNPLSLPEDRFNIWSAWTNFAPRLTTPDHDRQAGQAVMTSEDASLDASLTRSANTNVVHSLGWLNRSFDHVDVIGDGRGHYRDAPADAHNEAPQRTLDPATGLITTFPTLVWHNRPYANPYELMMVPASSSATRATEFTVSQPLPPYKGANPLLDTLAYRGPFGHLLNFFHSSQGTRNESSSELAGNYFRLFDFVTVPSPFKGTKTWYQTNRTAWSRVLWNNTTVNADSPIGLATNPAALSEFREPGKVNLNTAPDSVWNMSRATEKLGFDSLLKSWDTPGTVLRRGEEFELSMAGGYERISTENTLSANVSGRFPNGQHPAEYPNPLRAGIGADLMPPPLSGAPAPAPAPAADATMLRGSAVDRQPILGRFALAPPTGNPRQTAAYTLQNRRTNAYFRFKDLMKLGNSVTSQSNVYAVWITIGYFEIEPNIGVNGEVFHVDPAHPDGYRFGLEMGSDLGQVTRHRSFYVIDRSIPVAFEPGKNHNVDKAILVRRHLE